MRLIKYFVMLITVWSHLLIFPYTSPVTFRFMRFFLPFFWVTLLIANRVIGAHQPCISEQIA